MGAGKGKTKRVVTEASNQQSSILKTAAKKKVMKLGGTLDLFTLMGPHSYGLAHADSDLDYRGVYTFPLKKKLSLRGQEETLTLPEGDVVLHELSKFCSLAAKANPSILEMLFVPGEVASELGQKLQEQRSIFLSEKAKATFVGYATGQIKKLQLCEADQQAEGQQDRGVYQNSKKKRKAYTSLLSSPQTRRGVATHGETHSKAQS